MIRTNNCIVIFLVMSALPGHFSSYNLLVSGWTLDKHAWGFHDALSVSSSIINK